MREVLPTQLETSWKGKLDQKVLIRKTRLITRTRAVHDRALVDAQVDLNPHQVEAALFAFKSPLSKGAILADEVGLGKTIEAGLVLSQRWAERKRRILVITPANLRKQWYQELQEKFSHSIAFSGNLLSPSQ
jgi:SNF2 family DNA or RNA helicase